MRRGVEVRKEGTAAMTAPQFTGWCACARFVAMDDAGLIVEDGIRKAFETVSEQRAIRGFLITARRLRAHLLNPPNASM